MEKPWAQPAERVISEHRADAVHGLTAAAARRRYQSHGPNELTQRNGPSGWEIFARQLNSPFILILLLASALAVWQKEVSDAVVILVVIAINSVIGYVQEYRAERTISKLRAILSPQARVIRDSIEQKINARLLVPGDIVLLEAGDRVPADVRLLEAHDLRINQATLTGESVPAHKRSGLLAPGAELIDRTNMAFLSTLVVTGRATGVVTATGMATELGHIAKEVGALHDAPPTLTRQINALGRLLILLSVLLALVVLLVGVVSDQPFSQMVRVAVSLLVSLVPEGIPVVVTVVLSVGLLRLFHRQALVRRLSAAETLGETTIICIDKTGTLTEGAMMVEKLYVAGREYRVDGKGFGLSGHFYAGNERIDITKRPPARLMLELLSLATMSTISRHDLEKDQARLLTDPTETALSVVAAKAGFYAFNQEKLHPEYLEVPFDQELRYSTSVHRFGRDNRFITKGAAEKIIQLSTHVLDANSRPRRLLADSRSKLEATAAEYASAGYRVTAIGYQDQPASLPLSPKLPTGMTLVGLVCMADPLRSDAASVIAKAKRAGIRVMMITGDHLLTAQSIARQVGLDADQAVHASAIGRADLRQIQVVARSSPTDKLQIVAQLQRLGEVVAMTGDGVNDAPALKKADIGIAMGRSGTDVAVEAADMVLLNDHFGGVVTAIGQGRLMWENLRKVVFYLVSTSLGEALIIILSLLLGLPLPILAIQILWMNLATDGVTSLALTAEREEEALMDQPPRSRGTALLGSAEMWRLLVLSATMTAGTLWLFSTYLDQGLVYARSVALSAMVFFQLFNIFNCRSTTQSIFRPTGPNPILVVCLVAATCLQLLAIYHPLAHRYLHTAPLDLSTLSRIVLVALTIVIVGELYKAVVRRAIDWAKTVA